MGKIIKDRSKCIPQIKGYNTFSLHILFVTFAPWIPLQSNRRHDIDVIVPEKI